METKLIDFRKLVDYKKSDIGIFLGCGSSINDITDEQWAIIDKCDTWTSNNFLYHWFIPDFYHVELKSERHKWIKLWKQRKLLKLSSYDKVKFIVWQDHCDHILPAIGKHPMIFGYPRLTLKRNTEFKHVDDMATHSQIASLTLVLDLMYKMKYKKVILFGVDMKHSKYFWTDTDEFGETHCNTNANLPHNKPHTTASKTVDFIMEISKRWFNNTLYIGSKKSLLYDKKLPYMDITKWS